MCQEKFATMLKKDPLHLLLNLQVSMEVKQFRLKIKHLRQGILDFEDMVFHLLVY